MDYQSHYDKLITKARNRLRPDIAESHHIIPKSLGGNDNDENLVNLTPEEHFTAHLLLAKIYGTRGMWFAVYLMTAPNRNHKRTNNKLYGWIRRQRVIAQTGSKHSAETRAKMVQSQTGKKKSEETKAKMRKPKSENFKELMSSIRSGNPIGKSQEVVCPHCQKTGLARGMKVWHFDRCKSKHN